MTARPMSAGSARPMAAAVQQAVEEAIHGLLRARTCASSAPAAPMPASMRPARSPPSTWPRPGAPDRVRDALNAHLTLMDERVAILAAETVAGRLRRALLGQGAALSLPHHRPAPAARHRARSRLALPQAPRRRGDARGGAAPASAITTSPPSAPPTASPPAPMKTLDRLDVVAGRARRSTSSRRRAPSCTTRCARWSARCAASATAAGRREDLAAALEARDRARCAALAPPHGLYLTDVVY